MKKLRTKKFFALVISLFMIVSMMPIVVATADVPPEVEGLYPVGVWPLDPGTYDPALDDENIPAGARVFGLWDAGFAPLDAPTAITGHTAVGSMAQLAEGTFYAFIAGSGFGYVVLGVAGMGAVAPPPPPPAAPDGAPAELAGMYSVGVWPLAPGTYDPSLDDENIPAGAVIFGLWDEGFAPLDAPAAVAGHTAVGSMAQLAEGTFYAFIAGSGFGYVVLGVAGMGAAAPPPPPPAAPGGVPAELAGLYSVGVWPLAPGTYDPALDEENIPVGATIFGLWDAGFAPLEAPAAVTGFTAVGSMAALVDGTFYTFIAGSGFGYIVLMGAVDVAAPAPTPAPAPAPAPAPGGAATLLPDDMSGYWFAGTDIQVGMTGYHDMYFLFDLAAAGFGTGHVYAIFFSDDGEIAFSQGTTLTTFDADFNMQTRTVGAGERVRVSEVNGYSFALGGSGNSLSFILTSAPGNFAGLLPDRPLADLALTEPPPPLEFTITVRQRSDVQMSLFDVHETYGFIFFDIAVRDQRLYIIRLKADGTVTFNRNVTIHFANAQTGEIEDARTLSVTAGMPVTAMQIHGGRWYLGDGFSSDFVKFVDDTNPALVHIPTRFLNPNDLPASMTAFRAAAILELHDGTLRPYFIFGGDAGRQTLIVLLGGIAIAIPLGIIIFVAHSREVKSSGVKFDHAEINAD
ncbi:MAG: hypothetical protein FWB97_06280 [Oscillospiraceae bacterium]|nr:hypothetical protein [Oscillospiraceae bacterium]